MASNDHRAPPLKRKQNTQIRPPANRIKRNRHQQTCYRSAACSLLRLKWTSVRSSGTLHTLHFLRVPVGGVDSSDRMFSPRCCGAAWGNTSATLGTTSKRRIKRIEVWRWSIEWSGQQVLHSSCWSSCGSDAGAVAALISFLYLLYMLISLPLLSSKVSSYILPSCCSSFFSAFPPCSSFSFPSSSPSSRLPSSSFLSCVITLFFCVAVQSWVRRL